MYIHMLYYSQKGEINNDKERTRLHRKKIKEYNEEFHNLDNQYKCATNENEKHRYMILAQKAFDSCHALEMLLLELNKL